jgi:hypothetical protein
MAAGDAWCVGMKMVSDFFGISETDFEIFRSDSLVTVFFENGISFQNFLSESVSESMWCFTDRFLRLPVFVRNYRICVSKFFGILQHVIFFTSSVRLWIRITYFCIFLDGLRFFLGIDGVRRQLRLTIWSLERIHHFLCTVCLFHTLDFRVFMWGCEKTLYVRKNILWVSMSCQLNRVDFVNWWTLSMWSCDIYELVILWTCDLCKLFIL